MNQEKEKLDNKKESANKKEIEDKKRPKTAIAVLVAVVLAIVAAALYLFVNKKDESLKLNQKNTTTDTQQNINLPELDNNLKELRKIVLKQGNGRKINKGDYAYVVYAGFLPDGTVFDTNVNTGQAIGFPIGEGVIIKGWDEGLLGVSEGTEIVLDIPASMAYGEKGIPGTIPPNTPLRFDILVVKVLSKEEAEQLAKEQAKMLNQKQDEKSDKNENTDDN